MVGAFWVKAGEEQQSRNRTADTRDRVLTRRADDMASPEDYREPIVGARCQLFDTPPEKHVWAFSGLLARYVTIKPRTARSRKTWESYTQFRPDELTFPHSQDFQRPDSAK